MSKLMASIGSPVARALADVGAGALHGLVDVLDPDVAAGRLGAPCIRGIRGRRDAARRQHEQDGTQDGDELHAPSHGNPAAPGSDYDQTLTRRGARVPSIVGCPDILSRLTYANIASTLALGLVLGLGTSYAADKLPAKSVGSAQIKPKAVKSVHIKDNSVTTLDVKDGTLNVGDLSGDALAELRAPRAYGVFKSTGTLVPSRSRNVTTYRGNTGDYCVIPAAGSGIDPTKTTIIATAGLQRRQRLGPHGSALSSDGGHAADGLPRRVQPPDQGRRRQHGHRRVVRHPLTSSSSSTHAGTSAPAGPWRDSWKNRLPSLGSRLSSSVLAPYARAARTKPAAG